MPIQIVQPYAKIIDLSAKHAISMLQRIEAIGRVSHRSEDRQTDTSWAPFLRAVVLGHGDWSITEHESISAEVVVDRGITHEWVRHRIGAYTQESTRFVNYTKVGHASVFVRPDDLQPVEEMVWRNAMEYAEAAYKSLVEAGASPQIARSVLPNALASKLVVTYNLRSWRHFFLMRTSRESHPQMREVVIPLLAEFKMLIPILYEDIEPEMRQVENLRKAR